MDVMINQWLDKLFNMDSLAMLMVALVGFIGVVVGSFALRYLRGDVRYVRFFVLLAGLVVGVMGMVSTDHVGVLLAAWGLSNGLLVRMMVHKPGWRAAKASGDLTGRTYLLGFVCLLCAFGILISVTGTASIREMNGQGVDSPWVVGALVFLLVGAMTQSAIWPFHGWLTSSLNSPTPVSAIMHAGLVNGGGFLLVRFAPLYLESPILLSGIFALGLATAVIGTLWKLMQSDVKRMLACSTMGQMGFMLAQCGLGLFPAAVAHLVWHGMFKAYLFLASGGSAQEKRLDPGYPPRIDSFLCALGCGLAGSYGFALSSGKAWPAQDTTLVLIIIAFLAGSQFALTLLQKRTWRTLPMAAIATAAMGLFYGWSVNLIESFLEPMGIMQAQPLNPVHVVGIVLLAGCWLGILFGRYTLPGPDAPEWMMRLYVQALNASQPHPKTVTAHRNHYKFL